MMWSILVAWALVDGFQDMWLVQSPVFPSQEACMAMASLSKKYRGCYGEFIQ